VIYRFARFEVDDREFRLSEDGKPVQLEPKVLRLLVFLIENRNRLVRKQELLDRIWPDAMVTENALTRAIGLLRKALNDDARIPHYLETIPTAGYRFIANVTAEDGEPTNEPIEPGLRPAATEDQQEGSRRSRRWVFYSAAVLIAAAIAGSWLHFHHAGKVLTERDTVVLADFENSTGDPVFDETLRRGLAVQLEQSPYLSLIADDRIQEVLKEMARPVDTRLTPAIAQEICVRTASAAVLDGSIAPLGSQYVLGLRARDCQTGKVLAEEQVQAARKEDVLHALDQIAGKFRTQVGESLPSVEKYDTPLEEATTASLEALKAYSVGVNRLNSGANTEALSFFSRALELDPNFAAAYEEMCWAYVNQREPELAAESIRKAYPLREKVNEQERLVIEAEYYWYATGELEKAAAAIEIRSQTYPRDSSPHVVLAVLYGRLGNLEKAEKEAREALRTLPNEATAYQILGADLVNLNRLDEAGAIYKLSDTRNLSYAGRPRSLYFLAFLKGDQVGMAKVVSLVAGKSGQEDAVLGAEADTEAWYGKVKAARALARRATDLALNREATETAAGYQVEEAPFEAAAGDSPQARADAEAAIKLAPNRDVRLIAALALAQAGETDSAEKLANELDKAFPLDTLVQRYWLPTIRAAIALQRRDASRAVELLRVAGPLDLAGASNVMTPSLLPVYVRGEAYLMLHDGDRAVAEFQKYIDHRGIVRNSPFGMLARLGLARAYAIEGNTMKARIAYQDFLTAWKDGDLETPILQQAKAEFAKLQ
jgi:eukaryotic-like serine/threonine-protein kinase